MEVITSKQFKKSYDKLPINIKTKVKKAVSFFQQNNFSYPGLRVKRMQGLDRWEARVDRSYRLTFEKNESVVILRTVGPHDEALGKK